MHSEHKQISSKAKWTLLILLGWLVLAAVFAGLTKWKTRAVPDEAVPPAPPSSNHNTHGDQPVEKLSKPEPEKDAVQLPVTVILQEPELPTGCEVTSLTIVLNYLGYDVSKTTLSDYYLEKGPVGEVLPEEAFLGDPRDPYSYGCYASVIFRAASHYLESAGSSLAAEDLTGLSPKEMYSLLKEGHPLIVWVTRDLAEPRESTTWDVRGTTFTWTAPLHCIVLTGYDRDAGLVYAADPLEGNVSYDLALFEERFTEMGSQCVVIR